ncbi:MAG: sigma factor-like helix-turn-helix DNA-binding protein [Clostridia bacterium]
MAKDLQISLLLDFYGEMLTLKQKEIMEDYYYADLSLAEISEDKDITRQGVRDSIKRAELQLIDMEEKLKLVEKFKTVNENLTRICDCALKIAEITSENPKVMINVNTILDSAKELVE